MNVKVLNATVLGGSILIFIAAFLGVAVNGVFSVSAVDAGGIWYLLPIAGLSGIVLAAMALADKIEIKVPALVIGGVVLVLGVWFATHAASSLDQLAAMQNDMSQGFASSLFTGKPQDIGNLPKSSFGMAFYLDLIGAVSLLVAGWLAKIKSNVQV